MNMVLKTSDLINVTNAIMLLRQVVLREDSLIDTLGISWQIGLKLFGSDKDIDHSGYIYYIDGYKK